MNELKEPFVIYNARKNDAPELKEGYECNVTLTGPEALILEEALERVIYNYISQVDSNAKYGDINQADIIRQKTEILIPICARLKRRNEGKDDA